jgi:hypothetical protein
LRAVPWLVPGFSIDSHLEYLIELQDRLEKEPVLTLSVRKYMIEAMK